MVNKPYYIGLTVGPEYAAYAVTNESYNLEKFKGQDMWGIYRFKEPETSGCFYFFCHIFYIKYLMEEIKDDFRKLE